jgi:hypothetical protein
MDVVTAYLYDNLDTDIYMRIPAGLVEFHNFQRQSECLKLERALYGLKQASRMWYERLKYILIDQGFKNYEVCPCIFIKRTDKELVIVAVYVDDLNIVGTANAISEIVSQLKGEFEMKDLGETSFLSWPTS